MIELGNNFHIVENIIELPNLQNRREIFCDIESQRNFDDDKLGGLYPFKGDKICGFSISADDDPAVWYIPINHEREPTRNLPEKQVMDWARDILTSCYEWINHYVKFDAMFFAVGHDVQFDCRLVCTLNLAKLVYSDRSSYKLKPLCKDWLEYDTESQDRVLAYLSSTGFKSYSSVPIDTLGYYANDDVRMNRGLYRYIQKDMQVRIEETMMEDGSNIHGDAVKQLIETEIKLTSVLFDMEKRGLRIDVDECRLESARALKIMIDGGEKIEKLTGQEFTNSNACMKRILLDQLKLPILSTIKEKDENGRWFDTGRPCFDKDAMALYDCHPSVTSNPKIHDLIGTISAFRKEQQYNSLFLECFLRLNVNGVVHPNYNQSVRTGRLSCSAPNSQQQNQRSKKLIHPHKGEGFISDDYSQIEYRLMVHYAEMEQAIKAYNEDPTTDYHQWVADLLLIIRKPAKQLNFGMVYGEGQAAVCKTLSSNPEIIELMGNKVNKMIDEGLLSPELRVMKFNELCKTHATKSYHAYHAKFPEIKKLSRRAINAAIRRGFIFNKYGRRRYLPGKATYKALNSLIQSCAADVIKERMIALSPRYNSESRKWGISLNANVHDEVLSGVPLEVLRDPALHKFLKETLEYTTQSFKVPITIGLGLSHQNWSIAAGDAVITETGTYDSLKDYKAAGEKAGKFIEGKKW